VSEHSPIGWTDATWPLVGGCEYVSPGCSNCWAVRDSWRMAHNPNPKIHNAYFGTVDKQASGKLVWSGIVRPLWDRLAWPLKWRGSKRVFVCSQSDLFNRKVPFEFIAAAFGVMARARSTPSRC
jgi:protein gp37